MVTTIGQALHDTRDTLASDYTSGGGSLVLSSGQGAKYATVTATAPYYVRVDDELFRVTARSTDTLTVVGAQGGTSAADHATSTQVVPLLTHVDWNAARLAIVTLEQPPYGSLSSTGGQNIANANALTLKTWDVTDVARNGITANLTNESLTVDRAGIYLATVHIRWATDVARDRYTGLYIDDVEGPAEHGSSSRSSNPTLQTLTALVDLAASDVLTVKVMQDSDSNPLSAASGCFFRLLYVGGA